MQARAGAIDELLASGALTDLSSSTDDIQAKLNKVSATSQVERELAALKTELAATPAPAAALAPDGGRRRGPEPLRPLREAGSVPTTRPNHTR